MTIEQLIATLKTVKGQKRQVVVAIDEEWNAFGELDMNMDEENNRLVIYPVNTFIE